MGRTSNVSHIVTLAKLIIDDIADQMLDYSGNDFLINKKKFVLSQMSEMIEEQDHGDGIKVDKGKKEVEEDEDY